MESTDRRQKSFVYDCKLSPRLRLVAASPTAFCGLHLDDDNSVIIFVDVYILFLAECTTDVTENEFGLFHHRQEAESNDSADFQMQFTAESVK